VIAVGSHEPDAREVDDVIAAGLPAEQLVTLTEPVAGAEIPTRARRPPAAGGA
jgi:hypothetical protein